MISMRGIALGAFFLVLLVSTSAFGYSVLDAKRVYGYVRDASTNAPLRHATVQLADQTLQTDELGAFEYKTPRGEYVLRASAEGYQSTETALDARDLFERGFFFDLPLAPVGVRLQVIAAEGGQPIMGARVRTDSQELVTDAAGIVVLAGLGNGVHVQVSAEAFAPVEFTYDADATHIVKLAPALVSILVLNQTSHQPIKNATISANGQQAATDAVGRAYLRALSLGARLRITAPEHQEVQVVYNGEREITAHLRAGILRGALLDAPTQKPIAGATIWLNDVITRTDEQGHFYFGQVPSSATLTIKAVGYRLARLVVSPTETFRDALYPFRTRGLHIYYGQPRESVLGLLERMQSTQLNTIVIDVKSDRGEIVWQSNVPLARQVRAYASRGIDLGELIRECRARNLYCIARTVLMKDDKVAYARPDLALHTLGGAVYADNTAAWLNPGKREVHDYALALSKELVALGFDEVQLDYIRYPGNYGIAESGNPESRVAAIKSLLSLAERTFDTLPAFLSGDVFGLTTLTDDENNIGQRLRDLAPYLDYISPMEYPDTYNAGMLRAMGITNCTVPSYCPYQVVYHSTRGAIERAGTTKVRAWIQAYGWGTADYLQERKAAEEAGTYGWIFWNNQGLYDDRLFR